MLDEDGALTVVPYRVGSQGHVVVQASVNDQGPFDFACDTGASISVVFDETRKLARLDSLSDTRVSIQGIVSSGVFPVWIADRVQVGDEAWADARLASLPTSTFAIADLDGILGVDFLSRYSVRLSVKDRALRLYPPSLTRERSYRGWTAVPLRQLDIGQGGAVAYAIDLTIGPETIPALFDLGATTNVMNWRAARSFHVRPVRPGPDSSVIGALESAPIRAEINFVLVKTESIHWRNRRFLVGDFPVFDVLDVSGRPMAIVGTDLFGGRDLIIDFARSRLLVKSPD